MSLTAQASKILASQGLQGRQVSDPSVPVQAKTDVQAGDDDFDAYRKRMMLGYKHR